MKIFSFVEISFESFVPRRFIVRTFLDIHSYFCTFATSVARETTDFRKRAGFHFLTEITKNEVSAISRSLTDVCLRETARDG